MDCTTCYGKGWVPEMTTAASSYMNSAGIVGLIVGWGGGLLLFNLFPRTFTGVFTLIWVAIAVGIAEKLSGGAWAWSAFAAVVAAAGSISAHTRTLRTLQDTQLK